MKLNLNLIWNFDLCTGIEVTLFMGVGASIFNPILNLILNNNFTKLLKGFEHFDEKVSMRLWENWDGNEFEREKVVNALKVSTSTIFHGKFAFQAFSSKKFRKTRQ